MDPTRERSRTVRALAQKQIPFADEKPSDESPAVHQRGIERIAGRKLPDPPDQRHPLPGLRLPGRVGPKLHPTPGGVPPPRSVAPRLHFGIHRSGPLPHAGLLAKLQPQQHRTIPGRLHPSAARLGSTPSCQQKRCKQVDVRTEKMVQRPHRAHAPTRSPKGASQTDARSTPQATGGKTRSMGRLLDGNGRNSNGNFTLQR